MRGRLRFTAILSPLAVSYAASVLALAIAITAIPVRSQTNDRSDDCANERNPDLAVSHCTRAIQSGQLSQTDLNTAFNTRGSAYYVKGDYDRAIEDYDQAIRLAPNDPNSAQAFYDRGNAYLNKGDYDRAIQDFNKVSRLGDSH